MAVVTSLQSLIVKGPRRDAELEPETAINTGLSSNPIVEVGSRSISENSHKATKGIPATELVALETSIPLVIGGNALTPARGEDACSTASSSMDYSEKISQVAGVLKD